MKAALGDNGAYQYATIYAQWGDRAKALDWLETAWRLRDPGLNYLKTDPLLDPLRRESRFQAIERELKFPPREPDESRPDWLPGSGRSPPAARGQ